MYMHIYIYIQYTTWVLLWLFLVTFQHSTGPLYPGLPLEIAASWASLGALPRAFVEASVPGQSADQRHAEWLGHGEPVKVEKYVWKMWRSWWCCMDLLFWRWVRYMVRYIGGYWWIWVLLVEFWRRNRQRGGLLGGVFKRQQRIMASSKGMVTSGLASRSLGIHNDRNLVVTSFPCNIHHDIYIPEASNTLRMMALGHGLGTVSGLQHITRSYEGMTHFLSQPTIAHLSRNLSREAFF